MRLTGRIGRMGRGWVIAPETGALRGGGTPPICPKSPTTVPNSTRLNSMSLDDQSPSSKARLARALQKPFWTPQVVEWHNLAARFGLFYGGKG